MFFKPALIAAFAAALALAAPTISSDHVLHEIRHSPPTQWVRGNAVRENLVLPMRIGMTQSNLDKAHDLLMAASDPQSSTYGEWHSSDDVVDMFAPAKDTVETIRDWLVSAGIDTGRISQSVNKQWLQFDATAAEAAKLFKAKYYHYEHSETGSRNVACDEYHIPQHLTPHIDYITPGLRLMHGGKVTDGEGNGLQKRFNRPPPLLKGFAPQLAGLSDDQLLALCDVAITPICIQTEYNITKGTSHTAGNELGIFESLNDYLNLNDLKLFLTQFQTGRIPPNTQPGMRNIDGATDNQTVAGPESDLDFQISYPIIWPQNSILFQTDDNIYQQQETTGQTEGFLNTFLDAIDGSYCKYIDPLDPSYPDPSNGPGSYKGKLQCGVYKPTNVISISYGGQEDDLPAKYQQRQCNEFLKLGLQGVSFVIASGDSGVAGPAGDNNQTDGCLGSTGKVFSPDFPASCPYVTAVGATVLVGDVKKDEETAVTRFPSGGGFSNIYARPSYQDKAVKGFLAFERKNTSYPEYSVTGTSNPTAAQTGKGIFNNAGRGYPDVSAVGDNVVIVYQGTPTLIGGTSAAAPVFAAILTRINEERLKKGKKTVGFVNPTLYQNPQAFHDITVGSNPGCGSDGFYATKGWDPLTGLGTPNYPALLKAFGV